MTDAATDPQEPTPPFARHHVIEADQFCTCGYNLHGQRVDRDERLGFEVVRCPECGRFHPAGHGSTAMRPWLARLAALMLVLWCGLIGTAFIAAGLCLLGAIAIEEETYLTGTWVDASNQQFLVQSYEPNVGRQWKAAGTDEKVEAARPMFVRLPIDDPQVERGGSYGSNRWTPPWWVRALLLTSEAAVGLLLGVFAAGAMWHLGRGRWLLLLWLALPAVVVWLTVVQTSDTYLFVQGWYVRRLVVITATAMLGMAVGLLFGRAILRAAVRVLVPPRPRQALAFLWHADGKSLPAASPQ